MFEVNWPTVSSRNPGTPSGPDRHAAATRLKPDGWSGACDVTVMTGLQGGGGAAGLLRCDRVGRGPGDKVDGDLDPACAGRPLIAGEAPVLAEQLDEPRPERAELLRG